MGRPADRGPGRRWLGLLVALVLRGAPAVSATLAVPAVPYVPQSEELCGGAALAMVLRYWGEASVVPQDFASALSPQGTGIPTDALAHMAEARGFQAFPFQATRTDVLSHLEKGRPLIALLGTTPGRYHYVVVLAWANQRVLIHDPAVGPFRILAEGEWQRRWDAAGSWTMLVVPAERGRDDQQRAALPPSEGPCGVQVRQSVDLALAGKPDEAKQQLAAIAQWCPTSSEPLREMAALEFRREGWTSAAELAAEAVKRDSQDRFAWELLATSRFLAGRRPEALAAWNRVGEPRLDLVQVSGLRQTPARLVLGYLGEDTGRVLTPERLRLVERRIEALPAAQLSRVSYRPLPGGTAELDVNVVERPAFSTPLSLLVQSTVRALSERAIGVEAFGLASSGDSLRFGGQWRPERSHGFLSASAPHFLGLPGIVTAEAIWDEQSYRLSAGALEAPLVRERRERASVSLAHWWAADTKAAVTVAADEWRDRGRYLSLSSDVEQRLLRDRVALRGGAAGWWSEASLPFYSAYGRASAHTRALSSRTMLRADVSYEFASARAPLALWAGAGTSVARPALLRAHPLLRDGVIEGPAFGRQLLGGSVEADHPLGALGPAAIRGALFVDAARVLAPRGTSLVDLGAGLRIQPTGWRSALRVDLATPWDRLGPELSVGWQTEWP